MILYILTFVTFGFFKFPVDVLIYYTIWIKNLFVVKIYKLALKIY